MRTKAIVANFRNRRMSEFPYRLAKRTCPENPATRHPTYGQPTMPKHVLQLPRVMGSFKQVPNEDVSQRKWRDFATSQQTCLSTSKFPRSPSNWQPNVNSTMATLYRYQQATIDKEIL